MALSRSPKFERDLLLPASINSYVDTGLSPLVTYHYKLCARGAPGQETCVTASARIPAPPPAPLPGRPPPPPQAPKVPERVAAFGFTPTVGIEKIGVSWAITDTVADSNRRTEWVEVEHRLGVAPLLETPPPHWNVVSDRLGPNVSMFTREFPDPQGRGGLKDIFRVCAGNKEGRTCSTPIGVTKCSSASNC